MDIKIERFFNFIMNERTRSFIAFILYVPFIVMAMRIDLPLALEIIYLIVLMSVGLFITPIYVIVWVDEKENRKKTYSRNKKLAKEILMFIPVLLISTCITSFIMIGEPTNETSIKESFYDAVIFNSIFIIIIGPIIEEFIFRFLPYRFIKNKTLYIIISAFVFVALHVINDPNPLYYIWFYMMRPLYYGYRYHKTNDILVTISMHSLNNLFATLPLILSYF